VTRAAEAPLAAPTTGGDATGRAHWFRSKEDWCAAFWHAATHPRANRVAILCPSIGREHLRGQRHYRALAQRLAEFGVHALRFDYPATGNSTGDAIGTPASNAGLAGRWRDAIRDAARHARALAPGADVVLVGRRLGALLALDAREGIPGTVARCILWEPPASGRAFLRELRLQESARFDERYADEMARAHAGIALQTHGHRFDDATVEGVARLSLAGSLSGAGAVDIVCVDPRRFGATLDGAHGDASPAMSVMHAAEDASFDWNAYDRDALPEATLDLVTRLALEGAVTSLDASAGGDEGALALQVIEHGAPDPLRERFVRIGPDPSLFGALTERADASEPHVAVLVLGTGVEPSSGYGDMWTRFGRTAARAGMVVLRIDWRGVGESPALDDASDNVSYAPERLGDVRDAARWLRARHPRAHLAVIGLCAGGYYAVHAAAAGVDLDRIIAVNAQLYWREGLPVRLDPDDLAPAREAELAERASVALGDGSKWRRLLRGDYSRRAVFGAVRGMIARRMPSLRARSDTLGGRLTRLDLGTLFPGRVPTHLVYGDDDLGLAHLRAHGARAFDRMVARRGMHLHVLEGCDHTFSRESMRLRLDALVLSVLNVR
jgi:alpha-beta hydrolase superfamily lysophospholipase